MQSYQTASEAGKQPIAKESIASIVNDMDRDLERLSELYRSIDQLGDHLEGTRPRDTAVQGNPEPPAGSLMDNLRRKQRRLAQMLSLCHEAMQRVHATLGTL